MRYSHIYKFVGITVLAWLVCLVIVGGAVGTGDSQADYQGLLPLVCGITAVSTLGTVWYTRQWKKRQIAHNQAMAQGITLTIAPHPTAVSALPTQLWRRLHEYLPLNDRPGMHLAWEITHTGKRLLYTMRVPQVVKAAVIAELMREWPGAEVREAATEEKLIHSKDRRKIFVDPLQQTTQSPHLVWQDLVAEKHHVYPFYVADTPCPAALIGHLSRLSPTVSAGFQFLIRTAPAAIPEKWHHHINTLEQRLSYSGSRSVSNSDGTSSSRTNFGPANKKMTEEEIRAVTLRLQDEAHPYEVCIRVWAAGDDRQTVEQELNRLVISLKAEMKSNYNNLTAKNKGENSAVVVNREFALWGGIIQTARELRHLLTLPDEPVAAAYPLLHCTGSAPLAPEERILVHYQDTVFNHLEQPGNHQTPPRSRTYGTHVYGDGREVYVGHAFTDTTTHLLVTGATGSGKSVLAQLIALQDFCRGNAVLVLDPHGSLVDGILKSIPLELEDKVIVLDPSDYQPFRFNITACPPGSDLEARVSYVMEAIRLSNDASWETSLGMQELIEKGLFLVLDDPGEKSMADVAQAILQDDWRETLLKTPRRTIAGQQAATFWQYYYPRQNHEARQRSQAAVQRRLSPFLLNSMVRRTLGTAGSTINLTQTIEDGMLILAPMNAGMTPEVKKLWGALLVREFILCLQQRGVYHNRQATLVVDEVADSIGTMTEFFTTIVEQLRKYGAAACFFAQNFSQLPRSVMLAFKSNCRTQIAFSAGPDDAKIAAELMGKGVEADDIQSLEPYHAYIRVAVPGGQSAPCLIQTLPPYTANDTLPTPGEPLPAPVGVPSEQDPLPPQLPDADTASQLLACLEAAKQEPAAAPPDVGAFLAHRIPAPVYEALCELKRQFDQWRYQSLRHYPGLLPDKPKRIRALSRLKYGVPWWQSDVAYTLHHKTAEERLKNQIDRKKLQKINQKLGQPPTPLAAPQEVKETWQSEY